MSDKFETLHIYAQHAWHDSAYIMGTENDLKKLRDMIDNALKNPYSKEEFFVNDGEGYELIVKKCSDVEMDDLRQPYYDVEGIRGIHPFEEYRKVRLEKKHEKG